MRQVCRRLHLCPQQQSDYRETHARSSTVVERHGIDPERIQDKDHSLAGTRRSQLPRIQYTTIQVQCTTRQKGQEDTHQTIPRGGEETSSIHQRNHPASPEYQGDDITPGTKDNRMEELLSHGGIEEEFCKDGPPDVLESVCQT